jgi:general secretion pathway protein D
MVLAMTGCEFIGPQIHTKLPLPELKRTGEDLTTTPLDTKSDESKKTTKVEIFSAEEQGAPAAIHIGSEDKTIGGKGEYSLNFDDADLGEVAKVILSDILGKNYTISPQVTGKVTLQTSKPLSKEELLPTLDMLLSINNAALVNQAGMYLIKPSNEALYSTSLKTLGGSGYQVRIIPVKNVSANEVADILKPLLPEKALLHVDPKRNILLVAGSGAELNRAVDLVNTFDIDVLKGRSFALFTPAHVDASMIIEELDQIFNGASGNSGGGTGAPKKDKEAGGGAATSKGDDSFYRFIEIDRLNAILAITHKPQYLKDIETWVLRLDRTNTEGKGGVNVYRVQHHGALDLAHTLSNIFGNGSSQQNSASIAAGRNSMSASNRSGGSSMGGGTGSSMGGGMSSGIGGSSSSGMGSNTGSMGGGTGSSMGGGFGGGASSFSGSNTSNSSNTNRTGGMGGGQSLMPNVKIIADESNNALIIVANTQEYAIISKVLKQLDVLPLQVLIDATIVEVTLNDDLKYGIEWFLKNRVSSVTGGGGSSTIASSLTAVATGAGSSGFSYLYNSNAMNAVINAAATNNNVSVISSPSLMVLNNQEANILVGDSVPILSGTSTSLVSTGVTSNTVQMVDTGVNLSIKPRVNANGLVLMDLMQSVNAAVATDVTGGTSTINSPTIQKRQIETSVAVQSGETIILGGLIREENDYNRAGIPWLHELPLIGPLFGATTRNKDKTELVVLLTPRVMKSRQDAQDLTEEFKRKLTGIYDERINIQVEEMH